jgi:hypothetical protein
MLTNYYGPDYEYSDLEYTYTAPIGTNISLSPPHDATVTSVGAYSHSYTFEYKETLCATASSDIIRVMDRYSANINKKKQSIYY